MSSRVLRRLREEQEKKKIDDNIIEEEESDDDDDEDNVKPSFAGFDDESSSDDDDDDSSSDDDAASIDDKAELPSSIPSNLKINEKTTSNQKINTKDDTTSDDDFDAILDEFAPSTTLTTNSSSPTTTPRTAHSILLPSTLETRDFDLDLTLRHMLSHTPQPQPTRSTRQNRRITRLFGTTTPPLHPPHYIGGGLGMIPSPSPPPYPYDTSPLSSWYTFQPSDTYAKHTRAYDTIVSRGDPNHLALFVADTPYHARGALQLAVLFYRTGDAERGRELLKRALIIWEAACLREFWWYNSNGGGGYVLMDEGEEENQCFFAGLWRMVQVGWMVGCVRTSLAVGRFLLSLDPLRDPMGVLLVLDYLSLAMNKEECDALVVDLVESDTIEIHHQTTSSSSEQPQNHTSPLLHLPNWSYSYALALHRQSSPNATSALQSAISLHPTIVPLLLKKNNINIKSRSCRTDWPTALANLPKQDPPLSPTEEKLVTIFVERQHVLWSADAIIDWIYQSLSSLTAPSEPPTRPSTTALERYKSIDPSDYADRFPTLPADLNPLDPALIAPAMAVDVNRRRLLQRHVEAGEMDGLVEEQIRLAMMMNQGGGERAVVDPDDPLMEVFLRSLLPWNTVQGVDNNNNRGR